MYLPKSALVPFLKYVHRTFCTSKSKNKILTFYGTELWATGVRTAIVLGKEKTALASNRKKWLSQRRKTVAKVRQLHS